MGVSVNAPENLYRQASEIAAAENISIDKLFEERLLELERLKDKTRRGNYEKFVRVMSKVPAVEPVDYDRLRSCTFTRATTAREHASRARIV